MKPSQRITQIITSSKPNKYINNKKENVSPVSNNQIKEIKETTKTMKPSISSINCSMQKNGVHLTPIKRNNSNVKITINNSKINTNISEALEKNKNNDNKRKYIVTIIDRRQNFWKIKIFFN